MTKDDLVALLTPEVLDTDLWGRVKFNPRNQEIAYEKPGIETDLTHLQ